MKLFFNLYVKISYMNAFIVEYYCPHNLFLVGVNCVRFLSIKLVLVSITSLVITHATEIIKQ